MTQFFAVSLANPVILGNHIRVDIEVCPEYPTFIEIAASLPDLGFDVFQINERLHEADHSGVFEGLVLPDRNLIGSVEPYAELAVDIGFDYSGGDTLWFFSEVFEASTMRLYDSRRGKSRRAFLDAVLADEQDGIPVDIDPSQWRT